MCLVNDSGFKTVFYMSRPQDNWATLDQGPICKNCNLPKQHHGYYLKSWRCMSLGNSVFVKKFKKTNTTVHPPLTIKRRRKRQNG